MEISDIYHLLFETYTGIGILIGAGLLLSILVSVLLEIRTRKLYRNHEPDGEDEWSIFEDEVIEAEAEAEAEIAVEKTAAKGTK